VHWSEDAADERGYSGLLAPATFISIIAMLANRRLFQTLMTGYDTFVQTEQVFEMYKPIVAGDRLFSDVELTSVRRIAGKDLLTITNTFADQVGEVAQVMHTTVVGVTIDDVDPSATRAVEDAMMHGMLPARGSAPADPAPPAAAPARTRYSSDTRTRTPRTSVSFAGIAVGDEIPPRVAQLTRGDLVNYAGVAGDANPIHWDDHMARLAGLPDVIAHGMLTMGLGAGFVSSWLGDPGAVIRYGARLSNYTVVEVNQVGEIEFTGRVKSIDPETRTAVIVIVAKSGGRKIFGLATAEVRLS
jgi:acyl dehydratase